MSTSGIVGSQDKCMFNFTEVNPQCSEVGRPLNRGELSSNLSVNEWVSVVRAVCSANLKSHLFSTSQNAFPTVMSWAVNFTEWELWVRVRRAAQAASVYLALVAV